MDGDWFITLVVYKSKVGKKFSGSETIMCIFVKNKSKFFYSVVYLNFDSELTAT